MAPLLGLNQFSIERNHLYRKSHKSKIKKLNVYTEKCKALSFFLNYLHFPKRYRFNILRPESSLSQRNRFFTYFNITRRRRWHIACSRRRWRNSQIKSLPFKAIGHPWACIGVGSVNPSLAIALRMLSIKQIIKEISPQN